MSSRLVKVWDPFVRIFHWSLVLAFITAYASEDDFMRVHSYAGYTIIALLSVRIIWGLIGTKHARFSDFVRSPSEALNYLKETATFKAKRYLGHNPAGGLMIIALLVSLLLTTLTGLGAYGVEGGGPLAGWFVNIGHFGKEAFEEVHEFFANFTLFLVVVHIAGVILGSISHGENLVRAMFTGTKQAD